MSHFDKQDDEAKLKCTNEFISFLKRWEAESDLDSNEILNCVSEAVDHCYEEVEDEEEEVIEFKPDKSLGEDEE